jgi:small subunit ribosomal protein S8
MAVTDTVADMLTRIRNGSQARLEQVLIPASRMNIELTKILKAEGFIQKYDVSDDKKQGVIRITLKYLGPRRDPILQGLRRVSKPGLRVYVGRRGIPRVQGGLGLSILSTSKGIMTDHQARRLGVGGELLCQVW